MFTRGRTNPGLFPEVEQLTGDREGDLSALSGREFEVAIDTSGYVPRVVRASAELLAGSIESYVFVSSISVYDDADVLTEETPLRIAEDPESDDVGANYGALKALCEQAAESGPARTDADHPARASSSGRTTTRGGSATGRDAWRRAARCSPRDARRRASG